MPSSEIPDAPSAAATKPPRCAMCRGRMEVARREAAPNGAEKLTFKCPKCEFVKTKIVGDPLHDSRHRPPRKKK
ncbi:hypothetical protein [Tardiphaga sp.]|uniref:hypothetical protein n=1 Tax=Tardiphaga sp. TaxID=1926292 RepID=UPI00260A9136|nr:hypothetical protein [Tardiphaga sp.]